MKKRIFSLLLAAGVLCGCSTTRAPGEAEKPWNAVPTEERIEYDWMAGESPVPNRRVGLNRGWFMGDTVQTVSDRGIYFIYRPDWQLDVTPPSPWILYMDHGSDTVIKLCGRPDCTHDTTDCNAYTFQ